MRDTFIYLNLLWFLFYFGNFFNLIQIRNVYWIRFKLFIQQSTIFLTHPTSGLFSHKGRIWNNQSVMRLQILSVLDSKASECKWRVTVWLDSGLDAGCHVRNTRKIKCQKYPNKCLFESMWIFFKLLLYSYDGNRVADGYHVARHGHDRIVFKFTSVYIQPVSNM